MSCLPRETLNHFEQREQEILARNDEIERKRVQALDQACNAIREAESCTLRPTRAEVSSAAAEAATVELTGHVCGDPEAVPILAAALGAASEPVIGAVAEEALQTTIRVQNARILALQEASFTMFATSIVTWSVKDAAPGRSTPNGAAIKHEGILLDIPETGRECRVALPEEGWCLKGFVSEGVWTNFLLPGDWVGFLAVRLRGRMVMAQLVGLRMGAVSRAFRAMGTPSDYSFTYSFYLRCCGLHAQHEQLARGSWRNSGVFRAFFLGKKVEWKGKVRWSQQTVTADTVSVHMKLHEHVYGEPLLLMAAPGMLARGPPLSPGAWILFTAEIVDQGGRLFSHRLRLLQPLQFTEEEHGPASDSETDTAPETEEVESSSDERWNRRVESDASVAPWPTTVIASEEEPEPAEPAEPAEPSPPPISQPAKRKADGSPETDSDRVCVICQGLLGSGARSEPESSRELDRALSELSQRETEAQEARQESKQASEEAKRLQKTNASLEQSQEKLKKQLATLETKAKDLEVERSELTKERDQLDLKLRKAEAECSSKEARLNRLMEESDKWKAAAATANVQERDRVASDRKEVDRLTGEVRKLERQRGELINAFKKQMKLIEVLKRQRAHMEAARVLSFTEDEFIRILELGEKLGEWWGSVTSGSQDHRYLQVKRVPAAWQPPAAGEFLPVMPAGVLGSPKRE
ncbi:Tex9 [Symbiodinium sp. KB8]|nr:Tex9 [Symbiodinium sp. KB8]